VLPKGSRREGEPPTLVNPREMRREFDQSHTEGKPVIFGYWRKIENGLVWAPFSFGKEQKGHEKDVCQER